MQYGCLTHLFSLCAGHYPLDRGCEWCCGDQSLHQMLSRTSSLLCGCHCPVGGRVCSRGVGVEAPRSVSELQCEVGGTETFPLGEEPLSIPPPELSTHQEVCSVVSPVSHCVGSQSTLPLALPSGPPQLWECQQSSLVSLRCCVHKATSTDP